MKHQRPAFALLAIISILGLVGYWFGPLPQIGAGPALPASCRAGDVRAVMCWARPAVVYICTRAAVFVPAREGT